MLKGIPAIISPDLLSLIARMGHGDTLAIVDRNFPAHSTNDTVIRADSSDTTTLAASLLTLFPIDTFTKTPISRMEVVGDPGAVPEVQRAFLDLAEAAENRKIEVESLERFAFYERTRHAAGVIATGEARSYGCFLITKGVVFPVSA